jgi:hypothetical protein
MYRFEIEEGRRLVVAVFEGSVSDADLFRYLTDMLASTTYGAGWRSLIDFTPAETIELTREGVEHLRALPPGMERRLHGARAAILATAGSAAFGMARMYEILGSRAPYAIAVFSDREQAMAWLFGTE